MFAPKVPGTVPYFSLFWWWVGLCLHKPYPSSLHRRGFLHFRYLKFLMIFPTVEVFSKSKGFRKLLTTDFRLVLILDFNETHMCWGLNSHYFHVKGSSMVSFFHCSHIFWNPSGLEHRPGHQWFGACRILYGLGDARLYYIHDRHCGYPG